MQQILKRFSPRNFSMKHVLIDIVLIVASFYISLWLRVGSHGLSEHIETLHALVLPFLFVRVLTLMGFGVYQSMWRYISSRDASTLAVSIATSVPVLVTITYLTNELGFLPRSFFVIDAFVSTGLLMGVRVLRRRIFEHNFKPEARGVSLGKMIIYGAGQNGRFLAQRLLSDPALDRDILGFIDDDPAKANKKIQGLDILGGHKDVEDIIKRTGCTELIVAISYPPPDLMRELVLLGRKMSVRVQRVAHFDASQIRVGEAMYRQVDLKDLLNRPFSQIDLPSIKKLIEGKVVLITGAGGSIGSELSRQIARCSPAQLLLLDHSELNLFEIDSELRPATQDFSRVTPLLADIKDFNGLSHIFEKYQPQVVFHAAAYKHVHLVEANINSAVLNNVQGTWNLLQLCERHDIERFVMISTDKAVNPVGAMGFTKRVCELLTSLVGLRTQKPYSSVRFGNVLGSSGSLIPLLRRQIEDGGPVTITHPDMTRYFMLIPEAVSLVLMSATLSEPGDINVLKMGEPVKIVDLARSLIALMGKGPNEIDIAFTGVRPGEKMFEELYLTGDELTTRHPDILTVPRGDSSAHRDLQNIVVQTEKLIHAARNSDPALAKLLHELISAPAKQPEVTV